MVEKITKEIISEITELSRIEMSGKEIEKMVGSLGPVMEMIETIKKVELDEKVERNFSLKNIVREDVIKDNSSENRNRILEQFPKTKDDYLKTKKIL